ncbi:leucine-rich repeat flightless-interacting protein 2 isoform X10 [Gadus chalcogrammus]|uniref:leucine-rich repeat flightless-interacting protein 2 isoform X10 n=1 Tax=Gadus chalcogrammus TaxID=1042646 RepID=UPI0024C4DF9B|nr:leucine-rich repeat flightless-interacting protein 2 isoform X10 [Gadus chalcogrammus]
MGTQGTGRKRAPVRDRFSAEDEALSSIAREAEARLAAKRAARAEARDIRMRELERQQKELDDKCDKTFPDYSRPSSRCATPSLSAATLASLGGTSSRRGSVEAGAVVDPDASMSELRDIYELKDQIQDVEGRYMQGLKELKESLSEVEEKYKKAMVSNAQLDNDKANLIYQVDTLKDVVEEMEEQTSEMKRELEDKSKELERQKHTCNVLQHKQEELKEGIRQRDELIEKHGLVILPEGTPNGDYHHEANHAPGLTLVSQEAAQLLESAGEGPLDVRLRKQAEEKEELLAQIRRLKMQVEDERQKHAKMDGTSTDGERMENGTDLHIIEMQRDANRQVSEYKFKLSKAEQEMGTMEQNVNRLEGQVARYKTSADNSEKVEDELKVEKRKLQRELRTALDKNEEMEMTNSHLVKRLEKMKANRNALLAQQ